MAKTRTYLSLMTSRIKTVFKPRKLLTWAIVLLIVPFGFTLENPAKEVGAFLGK